MQNLQALQGGRQGLTWAAGASQEKQNKQGQTANEITPTGLKTNRGVEAIMLQGKKGECFRPPFKSERW